MDWMINLYAKAQGLTVVVMDALPLLAALGGILGVAASVLTRAAAAHDPAGVLHAAHPTAEEIATFSASLGVLKSHFNHQANLAAIEAHSAALAPKADEPPTSGPVSHQ